MTPGVAAKGGWIGRRNRGNAEEDKVGDKMEVVHGAKGKPDKVYRRRAKNKTLKKIKQVIKKG